MDGGRIDGMIDGWRDELGKGLWIKESVDSRIDEGGWRGIENDCILRKGGCYWDIYIHVYGGIAGTETRESEILKPR